MRAVVEQHHVVHVVLTDRPRRILPEVEAMMSYRRAQLLLLLLLVPVPLQGVVLRPAALHCQHLARWPRASIHRVSPL